MSERLQRVVLADAPFGAIVRHKGRWGVVSYAPPGFRRAWRSCIVDFWDGGMEYVKDTDIVELAPNKRGMAA